MDRATVALHVLGDKAEHQWQYSVKPCIAYTERQREGRYNASKNERATRFVAVGGHLREGTEERGFGALPPSVARASSRIPKPLQYLSAAAAWCSSVPVRWWRRTICTPSEFLMSMHSRLGFPVFRGGFQHTCRVGDQRGVHLHTSHPGQLRPSALAKTKDRNLSQRSSATTAVTRERCTITQYGWVSIEVRVVISKLYTIIAFAICYPFSSHLAA